MQEMIDNSDFDVNTPEDFVKIPDDDWNKYVRDVTSFRDWDSMKKKAGQLYFKKKLRF
jgi:hypothetical protein